MVRSFGLLLVVGVAIAFGLALTVGFAALSLRARGRGGIPGVLVFRPRCGVERMPAHRRLTHRPRGRLLGAGLVLAVIGWGRGHSDRERLGRARAGAAEIREVRDLNELQEATGVSGELDVRIRAPDLTDPATPRWMAGFKHRVLTENGFSGAQPELQGGRSLPGAGALRLRRRGRRARPLRRAEVRATLRELPPYDLEQVAPADPRPACRRTRRWSASGFAPSRSRTSRR